MEKERNGFYITPLLRHSIFRSGPLHQREDVRFFGGIIQGPKFANFIKTPDTIEGIEILGVAGGEFASFEIAAAQIFIAEGIGTLPAEKMKTQPSAIGAGNALGFAKESNEQEEDGTGPINDAIFEINTDLGVSALEQALDLAEERFVHTNDGRSPSSKLSKRSAS